MIGILLALTINHWKQDRINKQDEVYYLKGLRHNIVSDSLFLFVRIESLHSDRLLRDSLYQELTDPTLEKFSSSRLTMSLAFTYRFTPPNLYV